ncbi:PefC/AfrB family outer membrane usher protein [Vagococcus sp. WN89Y]|uniref:PefC/AfrB family outer membrane usher protein n=1 Tax=Vagococcus sp. WN89Y TaxID=3457258 RepID=UPI003FCE3D6A
MVRGRLPALSLISLWLYCESCVATELNLDFLQGISTVPEILKTSTQYPQGQYSVDVKVNNKNIGRVDLNISAEEQANNCICFSSQWLTHAGVLFKRQNYLSVYDKSKDCYALNEESHTQVSFNYGAQTLEFKIPQAWLLRETAPERWDYGINSGRLNYYANLNKTASGQIAAFGNIAPVINMGRWVLFGNINASRTDSRTSISSSTLTLSTAISQVQGDLFVGEAQVRTDMFDDFNFYGALLRSNYKMRPWALRGYAPRISGVAPSPSRVTVMQNGYTIYSKIVPAGPYVLDDLKPGGNSELVVTVEDESGHITKTVYPVGTLPTLLRAGEFHYNTAVGQKVASNRVEHAFTEDSGLFWLGSVDYGFDLLTLSVAGVWHRDYQNTGLGITQTVGFPGAISLSGNAAKARYDNGQEHKGHSVKVKYAWSFTERSDLQVSARRYTGPGYVEFADFDGSNHESYGKAKSRYEARLSHRINDTWLSGSWWRQDYWGIKQHATGVSASLSTSMFGDTTLFMNLGYSETPEQRRPDLSASLSVSVPFTFGGTRHYSNSALSYSRSSGYALNHGVSAMVNKRLNYSLNANVGEQGSSGMSASASYTFDAVQTNMSLSKERKQTGFSASFNGSVLASGKTGLMFSKESSDTLGIVAVPGMSDVSFNGSLPSNKNGYAVVPLSEYAENIISVDMENIPDSLELQTTSYNVVPTEKALVYRQFDFNTVLRYILLVKDAQGNVLTGGNAFTEQKLSAGFISNQGVLLMNLLAAPKTLTIEKGDGSQCRIPTNSLNANTNKVQEVRCE